MTIIDYLRQPEPITAALVIALAGMRWATLIVADALTEGLRHRLFLRIPPDDVYAAHHRDKSEPSGWRYDEKAKRRRVHPLFGKWSSCAWCASMTTTALTWATWSLPWPNVALVFRAVHLLGAINIAAWAATHHAA